MDSCGHLRQHRAMFATLRTRDTRRTAAHWDRAFADGRWDHLGGLDEGARTAVIDGYCRMAGAAEPAILDIGCGEGVLLDAVRHRPYRSYHGIDLSAVAVERAGRRAGPRDRFVAVDARDYLPRAAPDIVVFNEVLYYFADVAGLVARYLDLLAPGGIAIASVYRRPRTRHVWRAIDSVARVRDRVTIRHATGTGWCVALLDPR
jgi:trans-aconitate methyltransferase